MHFTVHPLADAEGQNRLEQYCDRARSLMGWILEQNSTMQVRPTPSFACQSYQLPSIHFNISF
jgi:hypothetical protein